MNCSIFWKKKKIQPKLLKVAYVRNGDWNRVEVLYFFRCAISALEAYPPSSYMIRTLLCLNCAKTFFRIGLYFLTLSAYKGRSGKKRQTHTWLFSAIS